MIDNSEKLKYCGIWHEYESIDEMLARPVSRKNEGHRNAFLFKGVDGARAEDPAREWRGGISSGEEFRTFLANGWPEGVARILDKIGRLSVEGVTSIRRRAVRKDQGDELDPVRVTSGQLDTAWRTAERRLQAGGVTHARLLVQTGFPGKIHPDDYFWRGAVAVIVADALEEAGYQTEIMGYNLAGDVYHHPSGNLDCALLWPIKRYGEALDLDALAALTAHASTHRVGAFRARLSCERVAKSNMGHTLHDRPPFAEPEDLVIKEVESEKDARALLERFRKSIEGRNA